LNVLNKHPNFKVKFNNDFKKVNNSEFAEGTALIAYSGDNRNSSDITDKAFTEALPSLGLVPLVGHWLSEKQNFGGHDVTIEFVGNQLVLKDNTVPYGVVKENNNAEYVEIEEEDGIKHNYLKADVVLWYGRYPEPVQKVIDDGINQSMEINVKSYSEKDNGNFQIDSFEFSALCLLGKDEDEFGNKGEDNVEPCFPSASVTIDKFTVNNKFKEQFDQLLFALNPSYNISSYFISKDKAEQLVQKANTIFTQLGFECSEYIVDGKEYQITGIINKTLNKEATEAWGFDIYDKDTITIYSLDFETIETSSISISSVELLMNKNIDTSQQHFTLKINNSIEEHTTEEIIKEEGGKNLVDEKLELLTKYSLTIEQLNFSIDELELEELEKKLKEFSNAENKVTSTFSATYRQKRDALSNALDPKIERDADDNITYEEYLWVEDFDDVYVYVEKSIWTESDHERKYGRFTYTFDEVTITATISGEFEEMLLVWLTLEENQKLQDERNTAMVVSEEFEILKSKVTEYETSISTLTEQFNTVKSENETLTQSNQSLAEFKSNTETAQQKAFENQQIQLKAELVENFSKVLTLEEVKSVQDKDLSTDEMEKEFKLLYADKDLQVKFNKKPKKTETEIPINSFTCKKKDDWTSCIKK